MATQKIINPLGQRAKKPLSTLIPESSNEVESVNYKNVAELLFEGDTITWEAMAICLFIYRKLSVTLEQLLGVSSDNEETIRKALNDLIELGWIKAIDNGQLSSTEYVPARDVEK
jgi:predicted HTH transcriptional regulator